MGEPKNIILLGAGEVGTTLSRVLSQEGHNVVVIDQNPEKLDRIQEHYDVQTIEGNGADLSILLRAGIRECNLLMAVTDNDEVNMLSCLIAKNLGPVNTIARLKKEFYFEGSKTFYRNKLGIDLIVCPEILTAMDIVYHIAESGSTMVEALADGYLEVKRIKVEKDFKYRGQMLKDISFPRGVLIGAIKREGRILIPTGNDMILEGDILFLVGATEIMENLENLLGIKKDWWFFTSRQTAVIVGGGRIGRIIAKMLSLRKMHVKIIEEQREKSKKIAEELDDILVLCADGTDIQIFQEEHLETAHHFVAASNDDATNVLASLMAKDIGIPNIITIVERPGYKKILQRLGLPKVESPRYTTAKMILSYIENNHTVIHPLERGSDIDIVEIYVEDTCPIKTETLRIFPFLKIP
ncbi:MAG: Trk system potassium transporter TrkA [Planctomycetota bacterium]|nr:MAG: Trk system potassium transporter TrkA [Planctomycetota bacterium]